jgi:coenzyme PQQ synthesis protein D (PqqD)
MNPERRYLPVSPRYRRNPEVESAPMQDETILYLPATRKFTMLNRTAAFVWHQLSQPRSPEELGTEVAGHFSGVSLSQASDDVLGAIRQLKELSLVEEVV